MSYEISEDMIELLMKVRDRMEVDAKLDQEGRRSYICWNIVLIHLGMGFYPKDVLFESLIEKSSGDVRALVEAIESVLLVDQDDCVTFSIWLERTLEGDDICLNFELRNAYTLGRLAWLDKMIETRVVE